MDDVIARVIHRIALVRSKDISINFIKEIRKIKGRELIAIDSLSTSFL